MKTTLVLRDGFTRKNCCSFGFSLNYLSPTATTSLPILATWTTFFPTSNFKIWKAWFTISSAAAPLISVAALLWVNFKLFMKKYWYHYSTYTWTMVNIEGWYLLKFNTYELKSITLNAWFLTFPLHTSVSWNFQMSSEVMNGERSWSEGKCTVVAKYTPAFVRPEWSGPNQRQIQNVPCTTGQISSGKLKSGGCTNMFSLWDNRFVFEFQNEKSTYQNVNLHLHCKYKILL